MTLISTTVIYFSSVKEIVGKEKEIIQLSSNTTIKQLRSRISENKLLLKSLLETCLVAVNEEYTDLEYCIMDGDVIAFIPPVSGGFDVVQRLYIKMADEMILNLDLNLNGKASTKKKSALSWKQQQINKKNKRIILRNNPTPKIAPKFEKKEKKENQNQKSIENNVNNQSNQPESVELTSKPIISIDETPTITPQITPIPYSKPQTVNIVKGTSKSNQQNVKTTIVSSLFKGNPEIPKQLPSAPQTITILAPKIFPPNTSFLDIGVATHLSDHLKKSQITHPTNIQKQAIPFLLDRSINNDFIIKAQTGSGKTLAFLLPLIQSLSLLQKDRSDGSFAVILTPTRELAQQIYGVLTQLLNYTSQYKHWIVPGLVIGGDKRKSEKARLRKGVTILVSTPGRLLDHLKTTQSFCAYNLGWLILDEADRLLELGFKDTLTEIISILDSHILKGIQELERCDSWFPRRITVLCSATISPNVKQLASTSLINPLLLSEDSLDSNDKIHIPDSLVQSFIVVPAKLRLVTLISALVKIIQANTKLTESQSDHVEPVMKLKIIVFFSCCDSVEFHHNIFTNLLTQLLPVPIHKLHANLAQSLRSQLIQNFNKESGILLCTDVAARGLDIPFITHCIQYDAPMDDADYIHRIGRTARIGRKGSALLFLLPSEVPYIDILIKEFSISIKEENFDTFLHALHPKTGEKASGLNKRIQGEKAATETQLKLESSIESNPKLSVLAKSAFSSHIKAYSTHPSTQHSYFHIKKLHLGHLCKSFGIREAPGVRGVRKKVVKETTEVVMKRKALLISQQEFGQFKRRKSGV